MSKMIRSLVVLTGLIFSHSLFAASTVYEVRKGKNKIYLAGTIHLLREQDFPLPAEFDAAYNASQKIYFEVDQQQLTAQDFNQHLMQAMLLPDNKTLKDILQPDVWRQLQNYASANQFPLSQTMIFNAAMVGMSITVSEFKKAGAGDGVDRYYEKKSRADNKFSGGLEDQDEVIASITAMGKEDPNLLVKSTLEDVSELKYMIETIVAEWKAGDLIALDKDLMEKMRTELPVSYQSLVIDRNKKWQPKIEAMLKTPDTEMVLVGALHLSGKDGLVEQLKNAGYKVTPFRIQ